MTGDRLWKRADDIYLQGVNFTAWPINAGEVLVTANARGNLEVTAEDVDGNDISGDVVEGPPSILPSGVECVFVLKGGTAGSTFWLTVTGPTSDDELLTERIPVEVRRSFYE